MIHFNDCPLCGDGAISFAFSATDHTVSQRSFEIWRCAHCQGMFTQDIPDESEIGKYYDSESYISHSNTRAGWMNALYHQVRNLTLNSKKSLIKRETGRSAGSLLDVGCGTGAFLHTMQKGGWQVTGLEPDAGARRTAQELYDLQIAPSGNLFALQEAQFDAITLWHVLEHVHDLHAYISQLVRLLKKTGKLFIAVPNHTSTDASIYREMWAAYDVPRHLYHFSPHSMNMLLSKHGLKVEKMNPMWFDSFYVSLLSEKNKDGGGNVLKPMAAGIKSNINAWRNNASGSSIIYIASKD